MANKSKKKILLGLLFVILLVLNLTFVCAQEESRFRQWLGSLKDADTGVPFYDNNKLLIDFMIFFVIFLSITTLSLTRIFAAGGSKNAALGLSIALAAALALAAIKAGMSVTFFIPFVKNVLIFLLFILIFLLFRALGMKSNFWNFVLSLVVTILLFNIGSIVVDEDAQMNFRNIFAVPTARPIDYAKTAIATTKAGETQEQKIARLQRSVEELEKYRDEVAVLQKTITELEEGKVTEPHKIGVGLILLLIALGAVGAGGVYSIDQARKKGYLGGVNARKIRIANRLNRLEEKHRSAVQGFLKWLDELIRRKGNLIEECAKLVTEKKGIVVSDAEVRRYLTPIYVELTRVYFRKEPKFQKGIKVKKWLIEQIKTDSDLLKRENLLAAGIKDTRVLDMLDRLLSDKESVDKIKHNTPIEDVVKEMMQGEKGVFKRLKSNAMGLSHLQDYLKRNIHKMMYINEKERDALQKQLDINNTVESYLLNSINRYEATIKERNIKEQTWQYHQLLWNINYTKKQLSKKKELSKELKEIIDRVTVLYNEFYHKIIELIKKFIDEADRIETRIRDKKEKEWINYLRKLFEEEKKLLLGIKDNEVAVEHLIYVYQEREKKAAEEVKQVIPAKLIDMEEKAKSKETSNEEELKIYEKLIIEYQKILEKEKTPEGIEFLKKKIREFENMIAICRGLMEKKGGESKELPKVGEEFEYWDFIYEEKNKGKIEKIEEPKVYLKVIEGASKGHTTSFLIEVLLLLIKYAEEIPLLNKDEEKADKEKVLEKAIETYKTIKKRFEEIRDECKQEEDAFTRTSRKIIELENKIKILNLEKEAKEKGDDEEKYKLYKEAIQKLEEFYKSLPPEGKKWAEDKIKEYREAIAKLVDKAAKFLSKAKADKYRKIAEDLRGKRPFKEIVEELESIAKSEEKGEGPIGLVGKPS